MRVHKSVAGRALSDDEIKQLIEKRFVGPLEGFRSRKGVEFSASLEIKDDTKVAFVFPAGDPNSVDINWDESPIICPCPVCAKKGKKSFIYDTPAGYVCKVNIEDKTACNARLPKQLCKKDITPENALKFFTEGKTDLIVNMISKRGRPFSSFLLCHPGEKRLLGWEFPPREKKEKAPAKAKTKAKE